MSLTSTLVSDNPDLADTCQPCGLALPVVAVNVPLRVPVGVPAS
jgi:hypothetical protein